MQRHSLGLELECPLGPGSLQPCVSHTPLSSGYLRLQVKSPAVAADPKAAPPTDLEYTFASPYRQKELQKGAVMELNPVSVAHLLVSMDLAPAVIWFDGVL